jgi:hypothetical protein
MPVLTATIKPEFSVAADTKLPSLFVKNILPLSNTFLEAD